MRPSSGASSTGGRSGSAIRRDPAFGRGAGADRGRASSAAKAVQDVLTELRDRETTARVADRMLAFDDVNALVELERATRTRRGTPRLPPERLPLHGQGRRAQA